MAVKDHTPTPAARQALFGKAQEQVEEAPARIVGSIPQWLEGSLVVNGGGDYSRMIHMFDGYALVSKARFKDGHVWGAQRYVETKAYRAYKEAGQVMYREFATPPAASNRVESTLQGLQGLFSIMTGGTNTTDNASVSLHAVGPRGADGKRGQLLAMSETAGAQYLVDPSSLATLQQVSFSDGVKGDLTTAHPSRLSDGRLLNFSRTVPYGGFHLFTQDPETLRRTEIAFVADRRPLTPAWLHDFASDNEYAVLIEHPLYMNLNSLLFGQPRPYVFMDWAPEDGTRVTVVRLDGSEPPRVFDAPPFFYFHFGNCFQACAADGSRELVVDVAAYPDPEILNGLSLPPLREPRGQVARSHYKRMRIPLDTGATTLPAPAGLTEDPETNSFAEFPSVNPAYRGRPYRYAWMLSAVRPTNMGNALSKVDVQTGEVKTWHMLGAAVGEPLFVPSPGSAAEDAGVVLAPGALPGGDAFVVVLDAASMRELGRAEFSFSTPNRFHGTWLDGRP